MQQKQFPKNHNSRVELRVNSSEKNIKENGLNKQSVNQSYMDISFNMPTNQLDANKKVRRSGLTVLRAVDNQTKIWFFIFYCFHLLRILWVVDKFKTNYCNIYNHKRNCDVSTYFLWHKHKLDFRVFFLSLKEALVIIFLLLFFEYYRKLQLVQSLVFFN